MKILLIIFLVLMASHKVLTKRLVENTTCLGLVKPSNQQFRLTCSNPSDYHCLLDETFTREFEVCREWKWIPGGKCAYFNTYGKGNVDERDCKPGINLTCSESNQQFESYKNTEFTACYKKKNIVTSIFTTTSTSFKVTSSRTSDGDVETPSQASEILTVLPILFGIIVPFLSVFLTCSMCWKATKKDREVSNKEKKDDNLEQKKPLLKNEDSQQTLRHENEDDTHNTPEGQKRDKEEPTKNMIDPNSAKSDVAEENKGKSTEKNHEVDENFRKDDTDNTPEGQKRDKEEPTKNMIDPNSAKSDVAGGNEGESTEKKHEIDENLRKADTHNTPEGQKRDKEEPTKNMIDPNSAKSDVAGGNKGESTEKKHDVDENFQKDDTDKEKAAKSSSCSSTDFPPGKSDNKEENEEESTHVFDDTIKRLQREALSTDDDGKLCTELYNLLGTEGRKLTQEVMTANITRETGKSVKILLINLTDQEKNKLKEMLPEESIRILKSKEENDTSFHVSYGLHQIILDEEKSPKSGWGNPVGEKDIGIGDDVERLNRIQTIVQGISNPVDVSVENYIRLLDIMIKALTRLDPDGEFKDGYKAIAYKVTSIKNPTLTQKVLKNIGEFLW